ncbi:MAG: GGDEF domain-containing protein [Roseburia sp.]|nr:GGDEF domain-containing protein [Roseburia sp.]
MKRKHRSLHVQRLKLKISDYCMLGGVFLSLILLMVAFHMYTNRAQLNQTQLVQSVMENMAINQRNQFDNYVAEKIQILQAMAAYPEVYEMDEKQQEQFIKRHSRDYGFGHIFVMNTDGIGFYIDEGAHRDQKDEKFFDDVMENEVFVSDPYYTYSGTAFMTACVSIYNPEGEKVGALCGAVNLTSLQDIIKTNEMILEGQCFILNMSGVYLTSDNPVRVANKVSIYSTKNSELSLIREVITEKQDKNGRIVLAGVEYEAILTYLHDYNWVIVQIIPVEEIEALYSFMTYFQLTLGVIVILLFACFIRIIYRWNKSNEKIYTDAVTKGNSRAACYDLLESIENRRKQAVTIVYMDLNRFKYVNDTFGHDKGDELLRIFNAAMEQTFGRVGFVGRMGGDEFIAVLLDETEEVVEALWAELKDVLSVKSSELDFEYKITSSYGYATRPIGGQETLDLIMQYADEKMYEYKVAHKYEE